MARRQNFKEGWNRRKKTIFAPRTHLGIERLEDRHLLSLTPYLLVAPEEFFPSNSGDSAVEGGAGAAGDITPLPPVAPFALDQTFLLHSNPTAQRVIYLDFNGHVTTNNFWNQVSGIATFITRPFTLDVNEFAYTDEELLRIQYIWSRIAEDLIPFNINVTTQDPGPAAMLLPGYQRVVIGGNGDWAGGPPAVGIADVTFNAANDIAVYIFSENIDFDMDGNFNDEIGISDLATLAIGVTFGLGRDNVLPPVPPIPYPGHGTGNTAWAPIMGDFTSPRPLKQWSKGEYHFATNTQDDLAIITTQNGFTYRTDDHGNFRTSASDMTVIGNQFFASGIIERNTDVDMFRFAITGTYGEAVSIDIQPFHRGPNLDILAILYDHAGNVVATSNPVDELFARFDVNLVPGVYYVSVEGTGRPHLTVNDFGYSDYGSLGQYTIVGSRLELLVGVDFDLPTGPAPLNWTRYTGVPVTAVLSDLMNEGGITTPANLRIDTGGILSTRINSTAKVETLPNHFAALNNVSGSLAAPAWTFTWSDLDPGSAYEVYVFGLATIDDHVQHVQISGFETLNFTQTLTANNLFINEDEGLDLFNLQDYAALVTSTGAGTIQIIVTPEAGQAYVGGLAIRPAQNGSIQGQKWNDLNGDGIKDPGEPGLGGWTIFLDENDNGILDSTLGITVFSADIPQDISDLAIVKSDLQFSGLSSIVDIDVMIDITHTYNGDLDVFLISPTGTRVELFTDVGGFTQNFQGTIFDDDAPISITAGTGPFIGSYRPEQPLSTFNGENPNGIWTLEIKDDANTDFGVLNAWSITIVGSERSTVTDANGNYKFEEVLPGRYTVREVLEFNSPWVQTFSPPPVTVSSAALVENIDFGNWIPAVISTTTTGIKWNDLNGDGMKTADEPGLPGWEIYIDGNDNGMLDEAAELIIVSEAVPRPIQDFKTTISQISVEGLASIIDVDVTIDITHSYAADLDVYLISPTGRQVELFTGVGGQFNNFTNITLDDSAELSVVEGAAPFTGTFRPEGLLSDFNGEDPTGTWQLLIRDTGLGDQGTLNSWSLKIIGRERSVIADANGNFVFIDLEPGLYIVREVMQPGWVQTAPIQGFGIDYWELVIEADSEITGVDFGNQFVGLPNLEGDYNGDGEVNAADYVLWRDTMGSAPLSGSGSGADGNNNNSVDADDYMVWQQNFGNSGGMGSGASESTAFASAFSSGDDDEGTAEPAANSPSYTSSTSSASSLGAGLTSSSSSSAPTASRTTSNHSTPPAEQSDSALLAWLASLPEADFDRVDSTDDDSADWHFTSDAEDEAVKRESIDSAFELLAV